MMNAYLTEMTEVIQHTRGTIDKYIGDAIMAFWGAPLHDAEHATHGVEAALAMQKKIRDLDTQFAKNGWPPLNIGVGLNCGTMNVGDMGSKFRRAYTVMGDAVNIASRLEGLTKEYGVGILVSEDMVNAAAGLRVPRGRHGRREGAHRGHPDLRAHRQGGRGGRHDARRRSTSGTRRSSTTASSAGTRREEMLQDARSTPRPTPSSTSCTCKRIDHCRTNPPGPTVERACGSGPPSNSSRSRSASRSPARRSPVAEGVWWIRMPLPFALDHINLWILADGDGFTLVDTGYGVQATWDLWEKHFAGVMAGRPVKNIVVTHYHPDHVGSAAWLVERTGAPMWMTHGGVSLGARGPRRHRRASTARTRSSSTSRNGVDPLESFPSAHAQGQRLSRAACRRCRSAIAA